MNSQECNGWKYLGIFAGLAALFTFYRMLPDLKRYMKIESM
jgi:hypothetical protein